MHCSADRSPVDTFMVGENYFQIERTENTIDEVAVWLCELSEQFQQMVNIV